MKTQEIVDIDICETPTLSKSKKPTDIHVRNEILKQIRTTKKYSMFSDPQILLITSPLILK